MEIRNRQDTGIGNKFHISTEILLIFSIIFAVAAPLFSQGQLSALVTDFDQFPLPGVTVTMRGPELKEDRIGVTNSKGEYHFNGLPIGSYQIKFELPGFKTLIRENIKVSLKPLTLKVSLEVSQISEDITVVAVSPVIDTSPSSIIPSEGFILNETSFSLRSNIDQTWDQLTSITDIEDQRHVLIDASSDWLDKIAETQYALMASIQDTDKLNIIKFIFGGIFQRLNVSLQSVQRSSLPDFERQATNLRAEFSTVARGMASMATSGKTSFDLIVISCPQGAKVSYWLANSEPKEFHKRTPTIIKNRVYGIWYLKFEKEGFYPEQKTYDVFSDDNHIVQVVLRQKEQNHLNKSK